MLPRSRRREPCALHHGLCSNYMRLQSLQSAGGLRSALNRLKFPWLPAESGENKREGLAKPMLAYDLPLRDSPVIRKFVTRSLP